ncbi:MAG: hypothetical protein WCE75_11000 [Terracidiphilus sp.]
MKKTVPQTSKAKPILALLFDNEGDKSMPDQENIFRAHLHVATFCEKVLREADGVMSLIRMVDRFQVFGDTEDMAPVLLSFTVFISFKSGILRGKQKVSLRPKSPTGKDLPAMEIPVLFEGDDDRGPALGFPVNWLVGEEGLFWWDLFLNDELVTRMPLRVTYQRVRTAIAGN